MSAVTQSGTAADKLAQPAEPTKPAQAPVTHKEPSEGGSYTRNLTTGELERAGRANRQPDQE